MELIVILLLVLIGICYFGIGIIFTFNLEESNSIKKDGGYPIPVRIIILILWPFVGFSYILGAFEDEDVKLVEDKNPE